MNGNGSGIGSKHTELDPEKFKALVSRWMRGGGEGYNPMDVLSSVTAVAVMGDLSVGGPLMRGAGNSSATRKLM